MAVSKILEGLHEKQQVNHRRSLNGRQISTMAFPDLEERCTPTRQLQMLRLSHFSGTLPCFTNATAHGKPQTRSHFHNANNTALRNSCDPACCAQFCLLVWVLRKFVFHHTLFSMCAVSSVFVLQMHPKKHFKAIILLWCRGGHEVRWCGCPCVGRIPWHRWRVGRH